MEVKVVVYVITVVFLDGSNAEVALNVTVFLQNPALQSLYRSIQNSTPPHTPKRSFVTAQNLAFFVFFFFLPSPLLLKQNYQHFVFILVVFESDFLFLGLLKEKLLLCFKT